MNDTQKATLSQIQKSALIIGIIGLLCVVGGGLAMDLDHTFQSYLFGYIFWVQVSIGSLGILFIHHIAGGKWSATIRRPLEAGTMTLPLMALLFIPILFGMGSIYEWTHLDVVAQDPILTFKAPYLNTPFFIIRTVIYFAIWITLALLLNKWSVEQENAEDPYVAGERMKALSAPGMLLLGLSASFASFDWMMSIEPHWFSTVYGLYFIVSAGGVTFPLLILFMTLLSQEDPIKKYFNYKILNDLGNFLLAMVMLYGYVAFTQYLLIWSADVAEFTPWYVKRTQNGWDVVPMAIFFIYFAIPFLALLSRRLKRNFVLLSVIACCVLFGRMMDLTWAIMPAYHPSLGSGLSVMQFASIVGIGGIWVAAFLWFFMQKSPVVTKDYRLGVLKERIYGESPSHSY